MFELKKLNVHKIVATEGEKNRLLSLGFELVEVVEEVVVVEEIKEIKKEDEKTKKDKA